MQFSLSVLVWLACLVWTISAQVSYKSKSLCTTRFATTSAPPQSTGYAVTIPVTVYKKVTVTPTKTITPPAATTTTTKTTTSTVITTGTSRPTITKTKTATATSTATSTSTSTVSTTVTETTLVASSTVPAPAGFTPIKNRRDYVPKKRSPGSANPAIRGREASIVGRQAQGRVTMRFEGDSPRFTPTVYPTSTICVTLVQAFTTSTKTFTASKTATTTLPKSTNTVTKTVTATTSTSIGATSPVTKYTTITTTTFSTTTVTQGVTETKTETIEVPTSTAYAQCQSNNLINAANGNQRISQTGVDTEFLSINNVDAPDAVQCCVVCAQTANCAAFVFGSFCTIYTVDASRCDGSNTFGSGFATFSEPGNAFTLGNGQCGALENYGSID